MVNRALLCLWMLLPLAAMAQRPADFVFKHGAVYTVENELVIPTNDQLVSPSRRRTDSKAPVNSVGS
jgi:hypothetical protein